MPRLDTSGCCLSTQGCSLDAWVAARMHRAAARPSNQAHMAHRTEPRHPSPLQPALETAPLRPCDPAVLCIQARPAEPIHVGGVRYTELAACGLAQRFIRTLLSPHTLPQQPK